MTPGDGDMRLKEGAVINPLMDTGFMWLLCLLSCTVFTCSHPTCNAWFHNYDQNILWCLTEMLFSAVRGSRFSSPSFVVLFITWLCDKTMVQVLPALQRRQTQALSALHTSLSFVYSPINQPDGTFSKSCGFFLFKSEISEFKYERPSCHAIFTSNIPLSQTCPVPWYLFVFLS